MSGVKGNKNALGNSGGKSLQDRKLAAEVRRLTLKRIKVILEIPSEDLKGRDYELQKAVLIKLSGTILPRLNEHTGEDGAPIKYSISNEQAEKIFRRRLKIMQI